MSAVARLGELAEMIERTAREVRDEVEYEGAASVRLEELLDLIGDWRRGARTEQEAHDRALELVREGYGSSPEAVPA